MSRGVRGVAFTLMCCVWVGIVPAQDVMTWDGDRPAWTVISVGIEGVEIERAGQPSMVGWQDIHDIGGEFAEPAGVFKQIGETAWRAMSRLDRGDAFGAEPLFETLFERYHGVHGPTAAAVSEGLLRCRLRRDARAAALDAWLDLYANLSAAPARQPLWGIASPALDMGTLLAPTLPPLWYDGAAARAFAGRDVPTTASEGDEVAWAMRVLYRAAARDAVGDPIDADAASRASAIAARREGSDFVANMVNAQIGGEQTRRDARLMLEKQRGASAGRWRAVWATIAIGRSLLRERGESVRRRGVLELISVYANDRGESPYLTGLALADAAVGSAALGDDHAAGVLVDELRQRMPAHPVLDWPAFRELWADGPGRISRR